MLVLISPAKNLDFEPDTKGMATTKPRLNNETSLLVDRAKRLTRADLRRLMKISEPLADLNHARFQALANDNVQEEPKAAILAFNGDVYRGLDAATLKPSDLEWSQNHLRILSGLYGVLRPLDAIHPYRLEMGSRLDTDRGHNLYDFWGSQISEILNTDANSTDTPILNLASKEYFSAVDIKALNVKPVDAVFKEEKEGKLKILSFYAKFARGLMARWVIENRITSIDDVKRFDVAGYTFEPEISSETQFVFTRPQPEKKT